MSSRWIAVTTFVACAGVAQAQSPAVLGRADADFATALLRGGYADLAEKLCQVLETKGDLPPEEAAGVKALHLDLRLELALREPDLIQRKDLLTTILQEKEDLVRQYSGRKVAEDVNANLTEVYQKLGETIATAIQKEKDQGLVGQLQKEGGDIFKAAESKLESRISDLTARIDEATTPNPKLEEALLVARYNLPRTHYFHALLYGASDTTTRDIELGEAITGFQEFGLDYSDTLFNYEGLIYEGLCYKEQGNWDDAFAAFDDAIRLREGYNLDSKGVYGAMGPYEANIVSWGVLQKVSLLIERDRSNEAIAEAKTFFDTTPEPDEALFGLAIRASLAEAYLKAGDTRAAGAQADKLVAADPRGPWGAAGRSIQAKLLQSGGPVDPAKVLQIATTLMRQGESEEALAIAHQALDAAGKDAKLADVGLDTWLFIGSVYQSRGWDNEAAAAFDAAIEQYPSNPNVAEAVYQAMKTYSRLNKAEKKNYYKVRAEERQKTLATKFSTHDRAWEAQLFEAEQLANDGKYVEAAELYGKVLPTAPSYLEAQFRAGDAYFQHALDLLKTGPGQAEAKTFADQAERLMKKAMEDADKQRAETISPGERARLDNLGLRARNRLAYLYLQPGIDRAKDVIPLLEGSDERFSSSPDALSIFWGYRIDALRQQDKLEEAIVLLDGLIKRDPESSAIGPAAGNLARALDARANDLRDKENKPREALDVRRKAANFYAIAGRALLTEQPLNVRLVEETAGRLFTLGLIANEVPETQVTFVGWDPKKNKDTGNWTLAVELLTKALDVQPGYKMEITLGRAHGFLGNYDKVVAVLGALFDREKIYDEKKNNLNRKVYQSKPELLYSYFEWGVAEYFVAEKTQDSDRFRRAQTILSTMTRNLDANSSNWWYAKYYEIANKLAAGSYTDACFLMNDLDRTTSGFGQEFGLDRDFAKLKNELKDKCN
jgi:tetratricopeptide (TPR) repeat protein